MIVSPAWRRRLLQVVLLSIVAPTSLLAQAPTKPVVVRFGDHPGFGRIVFDSDFAASIGVRRVENTVTVELGGQSLLPASGPPRNVRSVVNGPASVTLFLAPNAVLRRLVINAHLILDVADPVGTGAPRQPASHSLPAGSAVKILHSNHESRRGPVDPPVNSPANVKIEQTPSPAPPVDETFGKSPTDSSTMVAAANRSTKVVPSSALVADVQNQPPTAAGYRLSLPFDASVGAAAFRNSAEGYVVFDERKPIDLRAVKDDPVFGGAAVTLLQAATVLRLPLPAPAELRLTRIGGAWIVEAIAADAVPTPLHPIAPQAAPGRIHLKVTKPGRVVSIPDPITGSVLLVGTQRFAGEGVAVERKAPDFVLLSTWQGVVVQPIADTAQFRADVDGFTIDTGKAGSSMLSSAADPVAEASRMSRLFDFPALHTDELVRRMQGAVLAASMAPEQNRAPARRNVAETMVALGLGAESLAVLDLTSLGDARVEGDPAIKALSAIAAILSDRLEDASGLDDPRLDGSDEIAFWRAIRGARRGDPLAATAQILATTLPLLSAYPKELQQRLLPTVAETLVAGGQAEAAKGLLDRHRSDTSLDFARALLHESEDSQPNEALAAYDKLGNSPDRLLRVRATRAATELRLRRGLITPAQAADTLGKQFYAWRGDQRELDLRLRVADLMIDSNQWRPALQLLREAEADWPRQHAQLHERLASAFARSMQPTARATLSPYDLVSLAGENADLMPDGEAGEKLAELISDKLLALDLPERAAPLLEKISAAAPPGLARSSFGARLASLRLDQSDPGGAIAALTATATEALPTPLLEKRTVAFARAVAQQGDFDSARAALTQLDSEAGDRALADLAEAAKKWPDAVTALRRLSDRIVPNSGILTSDQEQDILRLASAASEAGDASVLAMLRSLYIPRLPGGKNTDLVKLLASQPVQSTGDLPRSARDVTLARAGTSPIAPIASR